jgi:hypothetical protein
VFGEWGWTRNYDVQVAQNFERRAPGDKKETAVAAKVVVVSKVTIHELGSHTGVGEEWANDENAATRAEEAFKRACACFGASAATCTVSPRRGSTLTSTIGPCTHRVSRIGHCPATRSAKPSGRR